MLITATTKSLRQSAKKVRLSADLVRGLKTADALAQLRNNRKISASPVSKLILSAIANAEHNFKLDKNNLIIKEIKVDNGVVLKRWMPRAFGRATPIRKKTSHITLVLAEIKDSGKVEAVKRKVDAPIKLSQKPSEEVKVTGSDNSEEVMDKHEIDGHEQETIEKGGKGGHSKIEGGSANKGFMKRVFRRKAG